MQYQVLLDPAKLYSYHISVATGAQRAPTTMPTPAADSIRRASQFFYVRGLGLVTQDRGYRRHRRRNNNGVPVRIRDIGEVVIGHAPRLGEFGFQKNDDPVEGVILMLHGEQTQNVLKRRREEDRGVEPRHACRPT